MNRTVEVKVDSFVREDRTSENFGNRVFLALSGTAGSQRMAYLYARPPFRQGSDVTVTSAVLRFWLRGAWAGGPHTITVARITAAWKEGSLKWNNRPAVSGANTATVAITGGTGGQMVEVDVTAMVQAVASGGNFYGFRLALDTAGPLRIHSTETDGEGTVDDRTKPLSPELYVAWTRKPLAVTDLRPSGGKRVSRADPLYLWDVHTALGDAEQSHSQVQVSTVSDFATTVWDSGWEANTEAERRHGGAALTAGTTYYWRVRVRLEGRDSDWSDVAQFTYTAKAALTLNSPPDTGIVNDLTPPVSWTFAGTQTAYAVALFRKDDAGGWDDRLWSTGRKAGTDTSVTIPKDLLKKRNSIEYRVRVRVWDNVDRADDEGRAYVQVTRDFQYQRSGVPAAVTNLQASVDGPAILLTWDRTQTPDYFTITLDDEVVVARLDPEDVRVDADSYSYRLYKARPGGSRTVGVEAVVNSAGTLQNSAPVAATVDYRVVGFWIVHEQSGTEAVLIGDRAPDMAIGESSEIFTPVGRRDPVKITDSIRGYEGRLVGILATYLGVPARTWRNRLETIVGKGSRGRVRLIFLDYSFPVELAEASLPPADDLIEGFEASVDFVQTGDFTFRAKAG